MAFRRPAAAPVSVTIFGLGLVIECFPGQNIFNAMRASSGMRVRSQVENAKGYLSTLALRVFTGARCMRSSMRDFSRRKSVSSRP